MDDKKIIELFWARDEEALKETEKKYGDLCYYVASNILTMKEDREECLNDVLLALWNSIPPERPENLRAYIGSTTRNNALNHSREINAWKRGGNVLTVGEEFLETIDDGTDLSELYEAKRTGDVINRFLGTIRKDDRQIFVLRYYLSLDYGEISKQTGFGISKIKMSVSRTRKKLALELKKEGITVENRN